MNERFGRYNRLFTLLHSYITAVFVLFDLIYLNNPSNDISGDLMVWRLLVYVPFIIRILGYYSKYLGRIKLFFILNSTLILPATLLFLSENRWIQTIGLVSIGLTQLENIIQKVCMTARERQTLFLYAFLPLTIGLLIQINWFEFKIIAIGQWLIVNLIMVAITILITASDWERLEALQEKDRLIKQFRFEKESLKLEKHKHQLLMDELKNSTAEIEQKNQVLKRISAEMFTQTELLKYISSVLDIKELTGMVADSIIGATGVDTCMLVIHNQQTGEKYYSLRTSHRNFTETDFRNSVEKGLYDAYFINNRHLLDSKVHEEKYPFVHNRQVGSIIIVPLVQKGMAYGLLISEHRQQDMFDSNTVNFLKSITNQINIAINNANLYKQMTYLANRDGLTTLYNRRYIQDFINDHILAYDQESNNEALTLAIYDIDHFKKVNDSYGHLFGDVVLKGISKIAERYAKIYDCMAGRYGGEEFLFVFPGRSIGEVEPILRSFHQSILEETFFYKETTKVHINLSMGVSSFPELASDSDMLLRRADRLLYKAKSSGRGLILFDELIEDIHE